MTKLATLAVVLGLAVGFVGCGGNTAEQATEQATEKIAEAMTGENVDIDAAGTADIADLPEFLRYPGVVAKDKVSISTSEGKGTVWTLISADDRAKVGDWYRQAFAGAGWAKSGEMDSGESLMLIHQTADETQTVTIMLTTEDGKTNISLTHGMK